MAGYIGGKVPVVTSGTERKQHYNITTTTTSLTGLQYTPTKVHVFHNGVRLVDGTDYTATTGTSITLTNAAENGDDVVVISYASFQTSDTVSAANGGTFAGNVTMSGNLNTTDVLPSTDNTSDLGSTAKRYQDLYLSGGLYVGGTGSANKLDDYEEGTWTPVLVGAAGTPSHTVVGAIGYYVKIGNLVHATMDWYATNVSGGSGDYYFTGLPFSRDMNQPGPSGPARLYQVGGYNPAVAIYGGNAIGVFVSSGITNSTWRWGVVGDITGTSIVAASISYKTT